MVIQNPSTPITVYYQDSTTNQSFMNMYYFLKARGIKNNKFFLLMYDGGLMGVDLGGRNILKTMKMRVLRECMVNYW